MQFFALGACLCLATVLNPAMAVPLNNPGDQDLIRDRQNRLLQEQQRRLEELQELPGKSAAPVAPTATTDSRCFPIKDIELKGADALSAAELLQPYIGQGLGVAQLNQLLKVITGRHLEKGLVTSNSIEFFARGRNLAASVTFAHSLERPEALSEREAPIYFRLDVFL